MFLTTLTVNRHKKERRTNKMDIMIPQLIISFRGQRIEQPLTPGTSVGSVKQNIACRADTMDPTDVRLVWKGKLLKDDNEDLHDTLVTLSNNKRQTVYRLMATGVSQKESEQAETDLRQGLEAAPRIRDDLTEKGRKDMERRKQAGRRMMKKVARQAGSSSAAATGDCGFGGIETLPNLPKRDEAQRILERLANDPGVLACMAKHKWKVGSLAELYPEGKVGESEVCVMGLNQNKGMRILLRIRTDDLKGFRKIASIRKVLFHELAHNVHSEHDGKFFQLMRQVEAECNEMDWTRGAGLVGIDEESPATLFEGGAFRLGGNSETGALSRRELVAQAALQRMTEEEQEIENNCGCGHKNLFLPPEEKDEPMDSE